MGRPLKIAKAQAILTVTATSSAGVVTVTDNLTTAPTVGVIAGMPFVMATTTGGLTAGVVYYIKAITGNHTFTVASTDPSVQPQTSPSMSNAGPVTVKATVAPVDMYFNNPNGPQWPSTNANTYSVVGGNTALYGKQVLANVCIGQNGLGTVFASTSSNIVAGLNTDFANVATGSHIYAVWAGGEVQLLGTASSTHGETDVTIANTKNTGNFIRTSGNAQTLLAGGPVAFTANIGGLVTGTTYFILSIANASAFTVSLTPNGPEVDLSDDTGTPDAAQQQIVLNAASANNASGPTGYGDPFISALPEAGFIVRQKGKQKYLVQGTTTGLVGACYTANVANTALTPNTMTITATYANAATQKVQSLSDHTAELFTSTSGPVATGNIVLENAAPAFATFNSAAVANASNAMPYPLVQIGNA